MTQKPVVQIIISSKIDNNTTSELLAPRKVIIKSGFGAQARRAWIELYNEQIHRSIQLGDEIQISINHISCFNGCVRQIRLDNQSDWLTIYAQRDLEQELNYLVSKEIIGLTAKRSMCCLMRAEFHFR